MITARLMGTLAAFAVTLSAVTARQALPGLEYRQDLVIQLGVASLDRSIAFYRDTLGFSIAERRNDLKFAHITTNVKGVEFGLNEVPDPKGSGSVVLNIGVVHVASARRALEAKGVVFRGQTVVIPGKVALAAFADPDGHVLRLAGPPETALTTQ